MPRVSICILERFDIPFKSRSTILPCLFASLCLFFLTSCAASIPKPVFYTPSKTLGLDTESAFSEQKEPLEVRLLGKNPHASFHHIRLKGAEKLHSHDHHDLLVITVKGKAAMILGARHFEVHPGDMVEIPRGTPHAAQSLGPEPAEVYAVFTPPMAGKDYREIS